MQHIFFPKHPPRILAAASAVGYEEARGPFGASFDFHDETDLFGGDTWEHAEENLGHTVLNLLLSKAGLRPSEVALLFAGDLQNQCMASSEGLYAEKIPFCGIYGACSTVGEGLLLASLALAADERLPNAAVLTTSHHCVAERLFRTPLEYGGQRPPTAQWTATAGGGFLLTHDRGEVAVTAGMPGVMLDAGVKDGANMGAAMAPAALLSLTAFFEKTGEAPRDYDAIVTGDLGYAGSEILCDLAKRKGLDIASVHLDCGGMMYDKRKQDVHAGGSGCGCSAALLAAHFLPALREGKLRRILFLPTGALMNPDSLKQGGDIIGIAPLLRLEGIR